MARSDLIDNTVKGSGGKQQVVDDILQRMKSAITERENIDKEALLNREFLRGNQWTKWNRATRSPTTFTFNGVSKDWHNRPVFNHFKKIRNIRWSKYLEVPVRWSVSPSSTRSKNVDAAKQAQRYLDAWIHARRFKKFRYDLFNYLTLDGSAWAHFIVHNGVDQFSVLPYDAVAVQPGVTDPQRADWLIVINKMTVKEAERYAKALKAKPGKIEATPSSIFHQGEIPMIADEYGSVPGEGFDSAENDDDGFVIILEQHEADGTVTICTDKQVLKKYDEREFFPSWGGELFGGQRYRLFLVREEIVPGQLYGVSTAGTMRSINKYFNRQMGIRMDKELLHAHAPMLVPDGCLRDERQFTGEPGKKVFLNADSGVPSYMQLPQQQTGEFQFPKDTLEQMQAVSSTPDALMGQLPGGGGREISGRLAAILSSASQAAIAVQIEGLRHVMSEMGYMILSYAKHLGDLASAQTGQQVPILFQAMGRTKAWEEHAFITSDLTPGFSVVCEYGTILETNRQLREDRIRELYKEGLITRPGSREPDPDRAIELIGDALPVVEPYGQESIDRAKTEYFEMTQPGAQYIKPEPFEDHKTHLDTHEGDARKPDFYDLKQMNPQGFQMFMQHIEDTRQILAQRQMQEVMSKQQQIAGGSKPMQGDQGLGNSALPGKPSEAAVVPSSAVQEADQAAQKQASPVMNKAMVQRQNEQAQGRL